MPQVLGILAGREELELQRWKEKLAGRKRLVEALIRWEQNQPGGRSPMPRSS